MKLLPIIPPDLREKPRSPVNSNVGHHAEETQIAPERYYQMKIRTVAVLIIIGAWCTATLAGNDGPNTVEESTHRISLYQEEASKLSTSDVYKEIEKQRTILAVKNISGGTGFTLDEDILKATGYVSELQARRKNNEPAAAFYYGIYNWRICGVLESSNKGQLDSTVKDCWNESLESLKVASNAKTAEASFNIGQMYEKGWGVLSSKLVAADWYIKAAQQFNDSDSRSGTLTAIEAALNAVPDHPAALRLKKALLK